MSNRTNTFFLVSLICLMRFIPVSAKERVYMCTDRSIYSAGETVWFRAWVNETETQAIPSQYLYAELLRDGVGICEKRVKVKAQNGIFSGHLELPYNLETGWYTLRTYTLAQKDWSGEALAHTRLLISGNSKGVFDSLTWSAYSDKEQKVHVSLSASTSNQLDVSLVDESGHPVSGQFAVSISDSRYADLGFPAAPSAEDVFPEAEREEGQFLDFRVKSLRRHMPEKYSVTIMCHDIGYYFSTDITGDRSVNGDVGQSFRIPDLDYPEGSLFSVNSSGSDFLYPVAIEESFAEPFDYAPTYRAVISKSSLSDEALLELIAKSDTLPASRVSADRKPAFYRPERTVGPYSAVFERRQVKLREELSKYDDMDLMTYIASSFAGLLVTHSQTGLANGRTMLTTRSGSVVSRVEISHGEAKNKTTAGYNPVLLYVDGILQPDWEDVSNMTVNNIQNLYVLRGTEAALYKAAAVVLLELRRSDTNKGEINNLPNKTIGILPLGWQRPLSFNAVIHGQNGTLYWNPLVTTDSSGCASFFVPNLPNENTCIRLVGFTDGGYFFQILLPFESFLLKTRQTHRVE